MSDFRLVGLKNSSDPAIGPIGQTVLLSHHVRRYRLADSDKSRYESTTSISGQRSPTAIAMKVSQCLGFLVAALPSVGHLSAAGDDEKEAEGLVEQESTHLVVNYGDDESQSLSVVGEAR